MVDTKCKPVDSKPRGPTKYDVNWETVTWPEFHTKYPDVPKSSYYTYRADAKPITPEDMPVAKVDPKALTESSLSDTQKKICQRIAAGESECHACESEGIPIDQHLMWLSDELTPTYVTFVKECLGIAERRRKDELVDSIVGWKSRAWQASAWYLERKYPAEFARPENGGRSGNAGVIINLTITSKRSGKDITDQVQVSQTPDSGVIEEKSDAG